jgi:hypothetical protein
VSLLNPGGWGEGELLLEYEMPKKIGREAKEALIVLKTTEQDIGEMAVTVTRERLGTAALLGQLLISGKEI